MDYLTPPTAALQNLTITDSLTPPTTALKPRILNPALSRTQESCRLAYLNHLVTHLYGPSKTSRSSILPYPRPSYDHKLFEDRFLNKARSHAMERLNCPRRQLARLLRDMAKTKPEHREKLLLANLYIQQRKNKQEVLRIIKSMY